MLAPRKMLAGAIVLSTAIFLLFSALLIGSHAEAAADSQWFVTFEDQTVPPIARNDVTQLMEAGAIDTDGFSELVVSFGGEFKESLPKSGKVGLILIPDMPRFEYLLRTEGEFVFAQETTVSIGNLSSQIFVSEPHALKIAFPRYKVYVYNETDSLAIVALYMYRTR
ncbi:MAG: hypothetical protein JSV80_00510 [Acidobacteriota bacterium]|nr:MAG: hypothetical protein JSV80_00510 [Acidobacteriota bacterium]